MKQAEQHGQPLSNGAAIGLAAAIAYMLACRLVHLSADPPNWLSWSAGIYTDEGMYAGDARSMVLTGHWMRGDFHGAILSPLLYVLQLCVFRIAGAGLLQARLISVIAGLATVALLWAGMRVAYGERAAWMGALLLGIATPFVLYNRLALMETPVACCLAAAFACIAIRQAYGRIGWLYCGAVLLAVALAIKPLAGLILPAFALGVGQYRAKDLSALIVGFGLAYGAYWLVALLPHAGTLARMNAYYAYHQYLPHSVAGVVGNIKRGMITGERDGFVHTLLQLWPTGSLLALAGCMSAYRSRRPADLLFLVWVLLPVAFWTVTSYTPSRYYVLIVPAMAALAGLRLSQLAPRTGAALLGIAVLIDCAMLAPAVLRPAYSVRNAARAIERVVEPGSVIAGQFAPQLAWGTSLEPVYVQPGLANDDRPIERNRAGYVLVTDSPYWNRFWDHSYPGLRDPDNRIGHIRIAGKYDEVLYNAAPPSKWLAMARLPGGTSRP